MKLIIDIDMDSVLKEGVSEDELHKAIIETVEDIRKMKYTNHSIMNIRDSKGTLIGVAEWRGGRKLLKG